MKILHLPTSIGGNSWGLAQGEKNLGIDSKVLVSEKNWLNYSYDYCMHLEKYNQFTKLFKRIIFFMKVRNNYDIFHFNFGSSLVDIPNKGIHLWDLPFYNGKKVMTYNGCDARQKFPTMQRVTFSACHQKECYGGLCNSGQLDKRRQKRIRKVSSLVDHIFSLNPDLMHFLPSDKTTFLPYTVAGWDKIPTYKYSLKNEITILHAPTNRIAKGSDYILNALHRLEQKYSNIKLEIIEKIPYELALKKYQEADIIVDQVLIGWYGGFGVEVMKMGKPLAVFIREEDLKFIPTEMATELKKAIINIDPFTIESVLEKYIKNPDLLYKKSEAVLKYVNKWHNPTYVASLTKKVYESL